MTQIYQTISYAVNSDVAMVTLNRPEAMNAFSKIQRNELLAAIKRAVDDAEARVIVLAAAGRAFSVGHDLGEGIPPGDETRIMVEEEYKPVIAAIDESDKLVIAAVNGPAAGIGAAFALACDLMVMADDAYLYQAFIAIGLVPDGGACWQLAQQLGYRRALELVVDGEKIPAARCLELGLANRVVAADELLVEAVAWAQNIAKKAPLALSTSKRLLKQAQYANLNEVMSLEAKAQGAMSASEDAQEGIQAFLEKRSPVYQGK